jgi:hypothetical protein
MKDFPIIIDSERWQTDNWEVNENISKYPKLPTTNIICHRRLVLVSFPCFNVKLNRGTEAVQNSLVIPVSEVSAVLGITAR